MRTPPDRAARAAALGNFSHRYKRLRNPEPQPLQSTDLSVTAPPVPVKRPPRPWEIRQVEGQIQQTQALSILEQMATHLGGIANFEKSIAAGDVMMQRAVTIGSSGVFHHDWPNPYAAVSVANLSPCLLTVTSLAPMSQAPSTGTGVTRVRGGCQRTLASRSTEVTVYGAPGATFDITVYGRPRDPQNGRLTSVYTRVTESTTPLAASGTFNGAAVDVGGGATRFRAFASSDQAGTINMQQSPDGVTWYTTESQPLTAGSTVGTVVESITCLRYVRAQVVNGTVAQTAFLLGTVPVED